MYIQLLFIAVVSVLMIGQFILVMWFIFRLRDLKRARTDFKIPWWIVIFYGFVMIPIAMNGHLLFLENGFYGTGSGVPITFDAWDMFWMYVRSTALLWLVPIMAWLKHRKIRSFLDSSST